MDLPLIPLANLNSFFLELFQAIFQVKFLLNYHFKLTIMEIVIFLLKFFHKYLKGHQDPLQKEDILIYNHNGIIIYQK